MDGQNLMEEKRQKEIDRAERARPEAGEPEAPVGRRDDVGRQPHRVGRVGEGIVQPAGLAFRSKLQETLEEMTLAAAGTTAPDTGLHRRQWGICIAHGSHLF